MAIAALIIAHLGLLLSIGCVVYLAARHYSTHTIQREFVDPFKDSLPSQIGKDPMAAFRDLDDPISSEELEALKARAVKMNRNV